MLIKSCPASYVLVKNKIRSIFKSFIINSSKNNCPLIYLKICFSDHVTICSTADFNDKLNCAKF